MKHKLLILFALSITISSSFAQTEFKLGTDIYNRYVWRGQLFGGSSPSIQPSMNFSWNGLSVGAWGAYATGDFDFQEINLYLSYTFYKKMLTATVTDVYFFNEKGDVDYFDFDQATTRHALSGEIRFNGFENIPISALIHTYFYGFDAKDESGNNLFSSYAEISYNPTIKKMDVNLKFFLGAALNGQKYINSDGETVFGYYHNEGFAIVNVGVGATKTFTVKDKLNIPLSGNLIFNPNDKKAYFTFGVGFSL